MNRNRRFKELPPKEVILRMASEPTIAVIGPSFTGKSTLIHGLVNGQVGYYLTKGIGENAQTTIIPCRYVFDQRIAEDLFALAIKKKEFDSKIVSIELKEQLAILFANQECSAEDTLDEINDVWIMRILEPTSKTYHLGALSKIVTVDALKNALSPILEEIENKTPGYEERVKLLKSGYKKNPPKEKVKISEIRRKVFDEMWDEVEEDFKSDYKELLDEIGNNLTDRLEALFETKLDENIIYEYSTRKDSDYKYGGKVLEELFDSTMPYSLLIEEIVLACRPREAIIEENSEMPVRFCLRDTMGLTQNDIGEGTIKDALDIALNCNPDSILVLLSLEERDDILERSMDAISTRFARAKTLKVPIHVLYTKADKLIETIIYRKPRKDVEIRQEDYDKYVSEAIKELEKKLDIYGHRLSIADWHWLSLRFKEESMDPIQVALKGDEEALSHFTSEGFYKYIKGIVDESYHRIMPKGMDKPLFIQVKEIGKPAIQIKVKADAIADIITSVKRKLTEDKETYNRYLIIDEKPIHGRSVVNYYHNLRIGLGYRTVANVYGNFNIHMKQLLTNVIKEFLDDFITLYERDAVQTIAENVDADEIQMLIKAFDENEEISKEAYAGINPAIWEKVSEDVKLSQKLHLIFRYHFENSDNYHKVINQVALRLSYQNEIIREKIDNIYMEPIPYNSIIHTMQESFYGLFEQAEFDNLLAQELGAAMTNEIEKMFIAI